MDEFAFYNRLLNQSDINQLYNAGAGLIYPFAAATYPTVTINSPANATAVYWQDNLAISTTATSFGGTVSQSHYIFNASGSLISRLNATGADFISNTTGLVAGIYFFNATATNGTASNYTETRQANITYYNAILNISLKKALNTSALVVNATVTLNDLNNTAWTQNLTTTTGQLQAQIATGNSYNITTDAPGYALDSQIYAANSTATQYLNISLFTNNSVRITVRDETTGQVITDNITLVVTGTTETTYSNTTGTFYIDNLADGTYTLKFSGDNYTLNQYTVTVGSRSTQTLTAYLSASTSTTTFSILDFDSSQPLTGASVTQNRLINGTWTVVNSKTSDITGRAQLTYLPNVKYQFIVSKASYTTETFYLDPILFASYNIRLRKTATLEPSNTPDLLGVYVSYYNSRLNRTEWSNNDNNTLAFTITSPMGALENYNLTIIYPGGSNTTSGTNAIGEQFNIGFKIINATTSNRLLINYCYQATTSAPRCFNYTHFIQNATAGAGTWKANQGQTYGMGVLERVLLATVFIVGVAGMVFFFLGTISGLAVALMLMGYFYLTGFAPLWAFLPSMLVGFVIIMRGGNQ